MKDALRPHGRRQLLLKRQIVGAMIAIATGGVEGTEARSEEPNR